MSWPIPTLTPAERPERLRLGLWLPIIAVVAGICVGAVLLLWPHGKSTDGASFWLLVTGVPSCVCGLLFGLLLMQWERQMLVAEESEREIARVTSLWRDWARRRVNVLRAVAFLPTPATAKQIVEADPMTPVNPLRPVGFMWAENQDARFRRESLLGLIADRFAKDLTKLSAIEVLLILDDASRASEAEWIAGAKRALEAVAPNTTLNASVVQQDVGLQWLEAHVDTKDAPTTLVIAVNLWPDRGNRTYSEGGAALLLASPAGDSDAVAGRLYRPMRSQAEALANDLRQVTDMQIRPRKLSQVLVTALRSAEMESISTAWADAGRDRPTEVQVDDVLGLPGPVSGWVALGIALGTEGPEHGPRLVVWREPNGDVVLMCAVSPVQSKEV